MFKLIAAAALICGLTFGTQTAAQGLFSPVIEVNGDAITRFELDQRAEMLRALRAPGNPETQARTQLIEDRLKLQAARRSGTIPTEEEILDGMSEFAARANLSREEFVTALGQEGVAEETFRAFVISGLAWRTLIGQQFGPRAQVSEDEIDRALSRGDRSAAVRVLISEIIMPITPDTATTVSERARVISEMESEAAFADAARQFSATATRGDGGRLPWQNLNDLPAALQPLIIALSPGQVTAPLNLPDAVALFQLRAIEELPFTPPNYAAIEYAAYYMAGGRSDATLAEAQALANRIDRCDDLYGVAKDQPADVLERGTLPPDELPDDIAIELAKLDPGEVSTALTRSNGQTLVFLMLCGRSVALDVPEVPQPQDTPEADQTPAVAGADPDADAGSDGPQGDPVAQARLEIANGLRNRRLETLANGFLAQLQADARIIER